MHERRDGTLYLLTQKISEKATGSFTLFTFSKNAKFQIHIISLYSSAHKSRFGETRWKGKNAEKSEIIIKTIKVKKCDLTSKKDLLVKIGRNFAIIIQFYIRIFFEANGHGKRKKNM